MYFTEEQEEYLRNKARSLNAYGPSIDKKGWRRWSREREDAFIEFVRNKMLRDTPVPPDHNESLKRLRIAVEGACALLVLAAVILVVKFH